jgi:hypothetical protein
MNLLVGADKIIKNKSMHISYKINDKKLEKVRRNSTQSEDDTNVLP